MKALRVSRGIALLFLGPRRTRWGAGLATTSRPPVPPGKTQYPFYRKLGGPQERPGRTENLVPTGIRSRTVQPVAQSLYRLSYRAHTNNKERINIHIIIRTILHCTSKYLLTPWCRVLLEKLTGLQLVKKFPAFLWNPKVHYRTHKRPPPVPILGQPNPVHIPTSHILEIHPNIIHPSTPRFPQWSLSLRFPHQDPIRPSLLTHTRHMPSPSHSSRFYHPHNIG